MFKRLFLSIIILSALASEGGAYFSADLIDYYLINFTRLDMMQNSQMAVHLAGAEALSERKGTPAAFFKIISQNAIDLKNNIKHHFPDFIAIASLSAVLALIIVSYFILNIKNSFNARETLLNLTDSSPPVFC